MIQGTSWQTVWAIAAMRHQTKRGEDHLSKHAHAVLQKFVEVETAEVLARAWGNFGFVLG